MVLIVRLFEDIPFLRRFKETQREETAKVEAEKKGSTESTIVNEDGSVVSASGGKQGEGIFGGIGEEAAREATKAKTSKVFKEVSWASLSTIIVAASPSVRASRLTNCVFE